VIVHPSRDSYLKAVGMGGGQTSGASLIEIRAGAVAVRRIDLLGGRTGCETSALPHELTHVILADRFHDRRIPPWADEGAAVLADSAEKQRLHLRDLAEAEASGTTFDIGCLFGLDCPSSSQCGTFYGQSLSVVNFLVQRGSPQQFVQFVRQATQVGYDRALSESYGIRGVIELDRLWRHDSFSPDGRQELRPSSHGSIHRRFG
jgi:hypothetical protein